MVVLQKIKATSPACVFSCLKTKTPPFVTRGRHCCLVFGALAVFFAEQPADTVYFCCLYRPFGEDPLRARCRSQFFIADLCRCPTSRAFVSAVRTRWSFRGCPLPLLHPQHEDHGMARAVWKACRGGWFAFVSATNLFLPAGKNPPTKKHTNQKMQDWKIHLCLPSKPQISPSKARTAQQKGGICARLIMAGDGIPGSSPRLDKVFGSLRHYQKVAEKFR